MGEVRIEMDVAKMRRALQDVGEGTGDTVDEPPIPEVPDGPPGMVDRPQKHPFLMHSPLLQRTVGVRS